MYTAVLETVVKFAGAYVALVGGLAAFGFTSLYIKFFYYKGVPFPASIGIDGYLHEAGYATIEIILNLSWFLFETGERICSVGLLLSLTYYLTLNSSMLRRFRIKARLRLLVKRIRSKLLHHSKHSEYYAVMVGMLVLALIFASVLRMIIKAYPSQVAVGKLTLAKLTAHRDQIVIAFVNFCILFVAVSFLAMHLANFTRPSDFRRRLKTYVIILIAILLPFVVHVVLRSRAIRFAEVAIYTQEPSEEPYCGLMILETSSSVELWQAKNGTGLVTVVPREKVRSLLIGASSDIMELGRQAATNPVTAVPSCDCLSK